MIPLASIRLIISILTKLRLIPKCKIMTALDMTVLEDELVQLNNINIQQKVLLTNLQRDYDAMVLSLENHTKKLQKEKKEIIAERDIANQQYLILQDQITEATELSTKLKEALTKWTS